MSKSHFIIKCSECGKERIVRDIDFPTHGIIIHAIGADGEIEIKCDCGNRVENDDFYEW